MSLWRINRHVVGGELTDVSDLRIFSLTRWGYCRMLRLCRLGKMCVVLALCAVSQKSHQCLVSLLQEAMPHFFIFLRKPSPFPESWAAVTKHCPSDFRPVIEITRLRRIPNLHIEFAIR